MLSKGQGTTLNTYGQLIRALEKDHRAEEAEKFWAKRIGVDLHSVPWNLCRLMISVYYRNNMLENLVKVPFHGNPDICIFSEQHPSESCEDTLFTIRVY